MTHVLVIGGGPAGVTAALRARELGAQVTLIERGRMGGTCTNDGCVPTRVLAKAARLLRDSEQFDEYGLIAPSPQLEFESLMKRTQQVVYSMHEKKQMLNHLQQADVTVISEAGEAAFEDPYTLRLPDGRLFSADRIILSAGGRARRLDFPGAEFALTHSDIWSLQKLPKSLAVVGGAATGCQLSSIFSAFGTQVTILERGPRILGVEDADIAGVVQAEFARRGIQIIPGIDSVERIERTENGVRLVYRHGDDEALDAEGIVLSAGWVGNLTPLHLENAGVETVGPYVRVDDFQRTNVAHIFAAGDITGRMMLVQSAGYEALTAAENAVLGVGARLQHQIVPHGGFTDPEYAGVGLTEAQAIQAGYEITTSVTRYEDMDRAVIDGHPIGMCKLIVSTQTHRILGAHVVGEQALEIVHAAAAGMAADMWVEQLAELQIAYPTFTAILGLTARQIVRKLGVQPLASQWRSLVNLPGAEWEVRLDTGS